MSRARLTLTLLAIALSSPAQAWALDQDGHRDLTISECENAGLPRAFCARVGTEVYNVDHDEWDVMAAHAQPEAGQDLCVAADAAADRVLSIGFELREWMTQQANDARTIQLATLLGRALHTIQDNCAHAGVSNAQHAWHSLVDTCEGGHTSPDVQPEALECAKMETIAAIAEFKVALQRTGVTNASISKVEASNTQWPSREGVCEFLDGADTWDGIDRGWNNAFVARALRDRFSAGLDGAPDDATSLCSSGGAGLFKIPNDPVDVSGGPPTCKRIDAFCIGAADAPEEAPPWDVEDDVAEVGGCSTGSGASLGWGVILAAVACSRRRRGQNLKKV